MFSSAQRGQGFSELKWPSTTRRDSPFQGALLLFNDFWIRILFFFLFLYIVALNFHFLYYCIYVSICINYIAVGVYMQAWFLDQFGVLHDGKQPYPGAISTCMFSSLLFSIWVKPFLFNFVTHIILVKI